MRIYIEGGGNKYSQSLLRMGFQKLFARLGLSETSLSPIAAGNRNSAYSRFALALKDYPPESIVLLIDSEGPVSNEEDLWQSLKETDTWMKPDKATDDNVHLMVQLLEAWFLCDVEALRTFYGRGFRPDALPTERNIELVAKEQVMSSLREATRETDRGSYKKERKSEHGYQILELLDPVKVGERSRFADRLFKHLATR